MNESYVLSAITTEQGHQRAAGYSPDADDGLHLEALVNKVGRYAVSALNYASPSGSHRRCREELIKVAALAVSAVESIDRRYGREPPRGESGSGF